jgi:hypothetical protein
MLARLRVSSCCIGAVLVACALPARPAAAEDKSALEDPYFAIKLLLGVTGSVSSSGGSVSVGGTTVSGNGTSVSNDLNPTFGGGAQYMYPLHRYFALGGLFAVESWKAKGTYPSGSRNLLLDLSVVPQGKLPLTDTIELYLSVPIGLTLDFWNQVSGSVTVAGVSASTSADTAVGYNLSLLFGARFALSRSVGLLAEVGYTRHAFSHTISGNALGLGGAGVSADLTLEQLALDVGVFF